MTNWPKFDEFSENFRKGGGSFPIRKITLRFFGKETGWGRCTPKNFVAKSATFFPKIGWGGGVAQCETMWKSGKDPE